MAFRVSSDQLSTSLLMTDIVQAFFWLYLSALLLIAMVASQLCLLALLPGSSAFFGSLQLVSAPQGDYAIRPVF